MATDRRAAPSVAAAALMLLWPAAWNGYPIVFADTGTYLSQAIHRYAGWDRPVFYSLLLLPLHAGLTLWPVIIAQALLTGGVLWLVWRTLAPRAGARWFLGTVATLAVATWLPWTVSEVMPDLFTPLLVLVAGLLTGAHTLAPRTRWRLAGLATLCIVTQQSSVPLAVALALAGAAAHAMGKRARIWRDQAKCDQAKCDQAGRGGQTARPCLRAGTAVLAPLFVPPLAAILMLCAMNLAAHGRFALSPFGSIFLLARSLEDGPARDALQRHCPAAGWRLCDFRDDLPATSDAFLWTQASPLYRAGGPKALAPEAATILRTAIHDEPLRQARAAAANAGRQLMMFASGDGLQAWPAQVDHWIGQDFPPSEGEAYHAARQQQGRLSVPGWMAGLHTAAALSGVVACLFAAVLARRLPPLRMMLLTVLISLPLSAAITGGLSAPHDRYQSRIMWLPPFLALAAAAAMRAE